MWRIDKIKNGISKTLAFKDSIGETDSLVVPEGGCERLLNGRKILDCTRPRVIGESLNAVEFESGHRAKRFYKSLWVLFDDKDRQVAVGSLESCEVAMLDRLLDIARVRMEYSGLYEDCRYVATWVESYDV